MSFSFSSSYYLLLYKNKPENTRNPAHERGQLSFREPVRVKNLQHSGGNTRSNRVIRHVLCDNGGGSDDRIAADGHSRQDRCAGADPGAFPDNDRPAEKDRPVIRIRAGRFCRSFYMQVSGLFHGFRDDAVY